MSIEQVREIADAVLYEGYLLYPYRASSSKNRSRWQFGVLGAPHAGADSFAEQPAMAMQCLVRAASRRASVTVWLRFLQLQSRQVQRLDDAGQYRTVEELTVAGQSVLSWDEAVEREISLPALRLSELLQPHDYPLGFPGGEDVEPVIDPAGEQVGRILRQRWPLTARLRIGAEIDGGFYRLSVQVDNEHPNQVSGKDGAIRVSLLGSHLLLAADEAAFSSLLDPAEPAAAATRRCRQQRCFPVLAGPPGCTDLMLAAPIILYDYPQIAEQSPGALFDGTEIDEILTLRVLTMTEQEKAEARATDPQARAIIDRCENLSPADMQRLHGILRDPGAAPAADVPWWDPAADEAVRPGLDAVTIRGVNVSRGSVVRVHPSRRADAQDLFFADQLARVSAVLSDVDGNIHVALVLLDDPAIDLHEWYGRYFYFAPEELEPIRADADYDTREESRS
ncbi:MAG TPA: hypothetical protein VJ851_13420 [Jatrophihabitans sp.]|nr:hypothetical protein [Jatrophihabitans sp.]